jgi:hypothetical protein
VAQGRKQYQKSYQQQRGVHLKLEGCSQKLRKEVILLSSNEWNFSQGFTRIRAFLSVTLTTRKKSQKMPLTPYVPPVPKSKGRLTRNLPLQQQRDGHVSWKPLVQTCSAGVLDRQTPIRKIDRSCFRVVNNLCDLAKLLDEECFKLIYENRCWSSRAPKWQEAWEIV